MTDDSTDKLGTLADIPLDQLDLAAPAKRNARRRPDPPAELQEWAEGAERRLFARPYPPNVTLEPLGHDREELTAPHSDPDLWTLQLADAFGTRSRAVLTLFLHQLQEMCGKGVWDADAKQWRMSETELSAMLALVNAHRPKNEREAMHVAQLVGLHILSMKVTARAIRYPHDTRTVSNVAKLAVATADLNRSLDDIAGRKRTTRQTIKVTKETHYHAHRHDHQPAGGEAGNERQPHDPNRPAVTDQRAPLRCENKGGNPLPLPSNERT